MKKHKAPSAAETLRPEYDFSKGVRGKYAKRLLSGSNIVRLDRDVAEAFPNAQAVNDALRLLASAAQRVSRIRSRKKTAA